MTTNPTTQPAGTCRRDLGHGITNRTQLRANDRDWITRAAGSGGRLLDHFNGNTAPRKLTRYARTRNTSTNNNRLMRWIYEFGCSRPVRSQRIALTAESWSLLNDETGFD
jgi:hypothetical protein